MRRLLGGLLTALALLLVLLLIGLKGLETEGARRRIAAALSDAMGRPVTLGRLSVALFPKPALTARSIRIGDADSLGEPGIHAAELRVVPRLRSLLPGRDLTIARAELDSAVVTARRDSSGRWLLPLPQRQGSDTAGPGSAAAIGLADVRITNGALRIYDDRQPGPERPRATTITDVTASVRAAGGHISASPLSGRLGQTEVTGAMLMRPEGAVIRLRSESIEPGDVPAFLALIGVTHHPPASIAGRAPFEMKLVAAPRFASYVVTGKAAADRMRLGQLDLEQVHAPFRLERKRLTLAPITFVAYGGKQRGAVTVDLGKPIPRYDIQTALVNLDVRRALTATTRVKNLLHGRARVSGDLRGQGYGAAAVKRNLAGTIRFELTDGVVRGFPALAAISRALGASEQAGENTNFESLSGTATVAAGRARTRDLVIRSGELALAGRGTVSFDRTLDLRLIATLSPTLSTRLGSRLGLLNRLADDRGRISLPMTVRGTIGAPQIRVDVRAVARRELPDLVRRGLLELLERP
jgi:uncharacterized protein involved in outer membrane biogenesis